MKNSKKYSSNSFIYIKSYHLNSYAYYYHSLYKYLSLRRSVSFSLVFSFMVRGWPLVD